MSPDQNTGTGYLIVRVVTAGGAIPLENATVTVRYVGDGSDGGRVITTLFTDRVGRTEPLALPAPPYTLSQAPSESLPFSVYNVEVFIKGYRRTVYQNLSVFDGVTSIQTAEMIPFPDNASPDNFDPYNERYFDLPFPEL